MPDSTVYIVAPPTKLKSSTCPTVDSMHVAVLVTKLQTSAPLSHIRDARRVLDETMSSKTTLKIRCVLNTAAICCAARTVNKLML